MFEEALDSLSAEDITLTGGTGAAAKGALADNGTHWTLGITVQNAGTVKVRINRAGVEAAEKTVTVYKGPALSYYHQGNEFDDAGYTGAGTATEGWTLNVGEQSVVYVAVYKYAGAAVSVSGADAAKVTQTAVGDTAGGITASDTLAVFTVKTGDLVFDGGTRTFTLQADNAGDAAAGTVNVTLNVATNQTGAAVFKHLEAEGQAEDLERLDTGAEGFANFVDAFKWVENNAEADTEYTIRVESNVTDLPRLRVGLNNVENASLRLRGAKEGPWILRPQELNLTGNEKIPEVNETGLTGGYFCIQIGYSTTPSPKRTFILGKNITFQGGTATVNNYSSIAFSAGYNATLVLEPGSSITGHSPQSSNCVIRVECAPKHTAKDPTLHGNLRILGGAITGCQFGTSTTFKGLIYAGRSLEYMESGSFYLAPGNSLTLNNNLVVTEATDKIVFNDTVYSLSEYLVSGVSLP
jgi:hypothetical protein